MFRSGLFLSLCVLLISWADAAVTQPSEPARTQVFVSGKDGYHTYRIPVIVVTTNGTLLAFCEGRKGGAGDSGAIDLLMKRSMDGGKTWSPQQLVWSNGSNT